MQKIHLLPLVMLTLVFCSTKKPASEAKLDSIAGNFSVDNTDTTAGGKWLDLDIDQFLIFQPGDTAVVFPSLVSDDPIEDEPEQIRQDDRVKRIPSGLQFTLSNGKTKIREENKHTEGDDYAGYTFLHPMNDIDQWLLMGSYYESFDYILVDQNDGTESHLWGLPVLSPDKKYFLTTQLDIEAGYVANGFQLWSMENKKPILRWEKELQNWGAGKITWSKNNSVIAEQTVRDNTTGELKTRLIKMSLVWRDGE